MNFTVIMFGFGILIWFDTVITIVWGRVLQFRFLNGISMTICCSSYGVFTTIISRYFWRSPFRKWGILAKWSYIRETYFAHIGQIYFRCFPTSFALFTTLSKWKIELTLKKNVLQDGTIWFCNFSVFPIVL